MNDLKIVFERSYEKIMLTYYLLSIVAFYTHLKISEHGWFSDVFWWYKKEALGSNGLKIQCLKPPMKGYVKKRLCSKRLMKKYV